ncbi:hypothetical protein F4774DRAFT_405184 [Daldinia eschscholtzii]|nr:hypothetical protein F4774DRAFT_405184 [Daldinia eschscholtzii]
MLCERSTTVPCSQIVKLSKQEHSWKAVGRREEFHATEIPRLKDTIVSNAWEWIYRTILVWLWVQIGTTRM